MAKLTHEQFHSIQVDSALNRFSKFGIDENISPFSIDNPFKSHVLNIDDTTNFIQDSISRFERSPDSNITSLDTKSISNHKRNRSKRRRLDRITGLDIEDTLVLQTGNNQPHAAQTVSDRLDWSDNFNPTRTYRFKDDYLLQSNSSVRVQLDMTSNQVDAYLQIIDVQSGQVLANNDDGGIGTNSRLTFNLQAGDQYIVRATSYSAFEVGDYYLHANSVSSAPPVPPSPPSRGFSSTHGYGTVNAAAAVAQSVNRSAFEDVSDLGHSWNNNLVNAPEVWAQGYTGENVVVAVIDTGVDYTHHDLDHNLWFNSGEIAGNGIDDDGNGYVDDILGWDFVSSDNNPWDSNGHGTHVAGTIAAENNGFGVTGVAYDAKIMPIRVLGTNGSGTIQGVASGIKYAADNGADVINLSLGSNYYNPTLESAVQYAASKGSVVVMAAGNSGLSQPGYPARFATDWGISVGAIDQFERIASFSNRAGWNSNLHHVMAPGVSVESTIPGNRYAAFNGTSMAAPHVAGVVALMLSANPNLTEAQVREILVGTTTQSGSATSALSPGLPSPETVSYLPVDYVPSFSPAPFGVVSSLPTDAMANEMSIALEESQKASPTQANGQPQSELAYLDAEANTLMIPKTFEEYETLIPSFYSTMLVV